MGDQESDNPPFYSQHASIPPHQHPGLTTSSPVLHSQQHLYNESGMVRGLLNHGQPMPQCYSLPRLCQGADASTPAVVYKMQQILQSPATQYSAPAGYGSYGELQYPVQYDYSPESSPYGNGTLYPQTQPIPPRSLPGQYYQNLVPYYYQYPYDHQSGSLTTHSNQTGQFYVNTRSSAPGIISEQIGNGGGSRPLAGYGPSNQSGLPSSEEGTMRVSESATAVISRGPPRKPKQCGHALWVGNLPPNSSMIALRDHFSRDAKRDIESLFHISKSNCAFINYRTENACEKAATRFHDSIFQGVRLVCRLRKCSTVAPYVPLATSTMPSTRHPKSDDIDDEELLAVQTSDLERNPSLAKYSERYFIMKSLTLQDLEQSLGNGIWATQSHNENALNEAYKSADNVYLIFSVNKSGEYFGYARMASPISENAAEVYGTAPRTDFPEKTDTIKTIPTTATEFAPKGHIIYDSARGTIFWEAEHSDDTTGEESSEARENIEAEPQMWGKPFRVEWMSTAKLPFYRIRGLQNPWNANKEVKVARDGTELEPSVGQKLIQLFS